MGALVYPSIPDLMLQTDLRGGKSLQTCSTSDDISLDRDRDGSTVP